MVASAAARRQKARGAAPRLRQEETGINVEVTRQEKDSLYALSRSEIRFRIARSKKSVMVASGRYFRHSLKPKRCGRQEPQNQSLGGTLSRTFCEQGNVVPVFLDHLGDGGAQLVVVGERGDFWDFGQEGEGGRVQAVHLGERGVGGGQERQRQVLRDLPY